MDWFQDLDQAKIAPIRLDPNKYKIPVSNIPCNEIGAARMNRYLKSVYEAGYNKIIRTPSFGICIDRFKGFRLPCYDVQRTSSCIELTVLDIDGMVRIQFRPGFEGEHPELEITGNDSWKRFIGFCTRHDVKIWDYAVTKEEGLAYKAQIPKAIIGLERERYKDLIFESCHHLDLNASHPSGMAEGFPVLYPVIKDVYDHRRENPKNKAILTHVWGYMQSMGTQFRFSHISKAGMEYTCRRVKELRDRLLSSGRFPILYNTDGIWYSGDVYHAEDEGYDLGQWKNDYVNCKLRCKSAGCYEFQEKNGRYFAKVRGHTALDMIKTRAEWQWGDIYQDEATVMRFLWDDQYIVNEEGKPYGIT